MSWFEDISSFLGNVGGSLGSLFEGGGNTQGNNANTPTGTVISNSQNQNEGGGVWSNVLMQSLLNAGLGLGKEYFSQTRNKKLLEEYAKQKQAENKFEMEKSDKANAAMLAANRMRSLADLYGNYMNVVSRGGGSVADSAISTGQLATNAINNRAARL